MENLAINTVVIIKTNNINQSNWPLAKITEIHPGTDGKVRAVTVRTSQGSTLRRAITNLIPLPSEEAEEIVPKQITSTVATSNKGRPKKQNKFQELPNLSFIWLFTFILLAGTPSLANVMVKTIDHAIYVEKLGIMHINQGQFQIQHAMSKERMKEDIQAGKLLALHFSNICNISVAYMHKTECSTLQHHLDFETQRMDILLEEIDQSNSRARRGLLGTMLTSVFGANDEVYRDIDKLTENQRHVIEHQGQQAHIMVSTLHTFGEREGRIKEQIEKFHAQLKNITQDIGKNEQATQLYTRMLSVYQRALNCLNEINEQYGMVIHIGRKRASLFDLMRRSHVAEANAASRRLSSNLRIVQEVLTNTETRNNATHINIFGYLPIINVIPFNLLKITAVPFNITQRTYTVIQITDKVMAVNYDKKQYLQIPLSNLQACDTTKNHTYICPAQPIRRLDKEDNCVIEAIYENNEPCDHSIRTHELQSIVWRQMLSPNTWMFVTNVNRTISVICNEKRINILLHKAGIIEISPDCHIETKWHILLATKMMNTRIEGSYVHLHNNDITTMTNCTQPKLEHGREKIFSPNNDLQVIS